MKKIFLFTSSFVLSSLFSFAQILEANTTAEFSSWTKLDLDGDGRKFLGGYFISGVFLPQGDAMFSESYNSQNNLVLTPDNLLVSPPMNFSSLTNVNINWVTGTSETTASGRYQEFYSVYLVANPANVTTATPIFSEQLPSGQVIHSRSVNTSVLAGASTVYLVFRHHNCTNEGEIFLDDISVSTECAITSISGSDESAPGANDGSAVTTVSGGVPPYSYSWSPSGGNSTTASNLAPGTYFFTMTDAAGCSVTESVFIDAFICNLSATTSSTNVTTAGGSNGSASVSVSGGTGPYSYSWSPGGMTTSFANSLSAGTYSVIISDSEGCSEQVVIVINNPGCNLQANATATNQTSYGINDGTATVSSQFGLNPLTYLWNPTGGTSATATGLAPGIYTAIVTDANGCSATSVVTVASAPFLSVSNLDADKLEINVFPNPTDDLLNISSLEMIESIVIFSLEGKIVYQETINLQDFKADVTGLKAGTYLYILKTQNGSISRDTFIKN